MTVEPRGEGLLITHLPIEDMALLALAAPLTSDTKQVLTALLAGRRVAVTRGAMEYKQYRRTAPLGIYQRFIAMERTLQEMGLRRAGEEERQ